MPGAIEYLHEFFENQVDIQGEATALIGLTSSYTYREVEERANKIARYIRLKGVKTGDMVGLYLNRSELPILAILGILKAGAGYIPLDPTYPNDRIQHIINDGAIKVILTEQSILSKNRDLFSSTTITLDKDEHEISLQSKKRLSSAEIQLDNSQLCYTLYTSGSTGKPKGVMTEHRNIVNFVNSFKKVCNLTNKDRVYQGFSFGFDGSVEEIWMAYASGATLVTANNEIAGIPADAARYMTSQNVTYFSTVPTFLSMIKEDLPTVRLLVVSGEACPQETVDKWALSSRQMLNVYGPTEATVNTTCAECKQFKKVTIGKPLDNYDIFILDDQMQPVPKGAQGELYIGGPTLSRGYMNLPEITAKAFLPKPPHLNTSSNLIYKTGDLVSLNEEDELNFYGRIDLQVKIRGYRIELSEIESVLREHPSVHATAVKPFLNKKSEITELDAYVVPNKGMAIDYGEILTLQKTKLPPYMIPSYLDIIGEMPTLSSGKTDRKRLGDPVTPLIDSNRKIIEPQSKTEMALAKIWIDQFKIDAVSVYDNFFTDLGGYSLIAAQVVSILRKDCNNEITIRDVYQYPTISTLAGYLDNIKNKQEKLQQVQKKTKPVEKSSDVFHRTPVISRWTCAVLQAVSVSLIYSFVPLMVLISIIFYGLIRKGDFSTTSIIIVSSGFFLFSYPAMLLGSIIAKWLIIGKFKPGKYPLWSFYYFRWWIVTRLHRLSGASFLSGTPLMSIYLKLMGAKIGKNSTINSSHCSIFDLLSIGNNTTIGFETQFSGYRVENGFLEVGSVTIGNDCFAGIQSSIGLNTVMEDNSALDDMSMLEDETRIKTGDSQKGSPSKSAKINLPYRNKGGVKTPLNSMFFGLLSIICVYGVELFLLLSALPSVMIIYYAFQKEDWYWWISLVLISIPLFEVSFWTLLIITKHIILFKAKPGTFEIRSIYYLRKWTIDSLLAMSRLVTLPVYTTLYAIPLLRMLGVKIGKRAELSVLAYVSPDLVELGKESFFADGSIIGGLRLYNGLCEIKANKVGDRSFIGNSALLPCGNSVENNCLIGVLSVPPSDSTITPAGSEWLGSPSFKLPNRKKVEGFKDDKIYKPSIFLYIARLFIDALRIIIPSIIEIASIVTTIIVLYYVNTNNPIWITLAALPLIGTFTSLGMTLAVVLVKNILMGVYKPVIKPLWSPYVWLNEVVNGAFESVAAPMLTPLLGTPFISGFLRLFGVKVGKHVFVETMLWGEFDLVEIGDYAALNNDVIVQNHLFEDRIFKSSSLKIGKNCSLGSMAVVLYDTEMRDGSSIGSLSLLMKGESIPEASQWAGIPIRNID
jgi:non-ribosomal peptide synthetase-like protein